MTASTVTVVLDATVTKNLRATRKAVEAATVRRDDAIRAALTSGASAREIAAEVGLSHTWVLKIGREPR